MAVRYGYTVTVKFAEGDSAGTARQNADELARNFGMSNLVENSPGNLGQVTYRFQGQNYGGRARDFSSEALSKILGVERVSISRLERE